MEELLNLTDEELDLHIDAYAELVATEVEVEENNQILTALVFERERRLHGNEPKNKTASIKKTGIKKTGNLKKTKPPLNAARHPKPAYEDEDDEAAETRRRPARRNTYKNQKSNLLFYILVPLLLVAALIFVGVVLLLVLKDDPVPPDLVNPPAPVVTKPPVNNSPPSLPVNKPPERINPSPIVSATPFGSFEGRSFKELKWQISGSAFGINPVSSELNGQSKISANLGKFANSYHGGDTAIGSLISPRFTVVDRFMNFKMAGGANKDCTVKLICRGQLVRMSVVAVNSHKLIDHHWDTREFIGKDCQIVVEDADSSNFGWIAVDQFTQGKSGYGQMGKSYNVDFSRQYDFISKGLKSGAMVYLDRDYKFSTLPDFLKNKDYLYFNNDYKNDQSFKMNYKLASSATVYLLFDNRHKIPGWLDKWEKQSELVTVKKDVIFKVFKRQYNQGDDIFLGVNASSKSSTFYVLVFDYN